MHNLSTNFMIFLNITKSVFKSSINTDDNFKFYLRKPKLSDFMFKRNYAKSIADLLIRILSNVSSG